MRYFVTTSPAAQPWQAFDPGECLQRLEASEAGLSSSQCAEHLARLGPNHLELAAGRSSLRILWDQFRNVLVCRPGNNS